MILDVVPSTQLNDGDVLTTATNNNITIGVVALGDGTSTITIDETATVVEADLLASNGIIHVIDKVLVRAGDLPATDPPALAPPALNPTVSPVTPTTDYIICASSYFYKCPHS